MAELPEITMEIGEIKPQRWEYVVYYLGEEGDPKQNDTLNNLGSMGWELVTVLILMGVGCTAYLKRPIWSD